MHLAYLSAGDCGRPDHVQPSGHLPPVHRRPDRLHRGPGRAPERDGHILLDTQHLQHPQQEVGSGEWGLVDTRPTHQLPQALSPTNAQKKEKMVIGLNLFQEG